MIIIAEAQVARSVSIISRTPAPINGEPDSTLDTARSFAEMEAEGVSYSAGGLALPPLLQIPDWSCLPPSEQLDSQRQRRDQYADRGHERMILGQAVCLPPASRLEGRESPIESHCPVIRVLPEVPGGGCPEFRSQENFERNVTAKDLPDRRDFLGRIRRIRPRHSLSQLPIHRLAGSRCQAIYSPTPPG